MFLDQASTNVDFGITVETSSNRGFTPEEVAERCVKHIISVSEDAPEVIKGQALAYKEHIKAVVAFYLKEAVKSDRTTLHNELKNAGEPHLAELIRRL
jgi:hypothetical protein